MPLYLLEVEGVDVNARINQNKSGDTIRVFKLFSFFGGTRNKHMSPFTSPLQLIDFFRLF